MESQRRGTKVYRMPPAFGESLSRSSHRSDAGPPANRRERLNPPRGPAKVWLRITTVTKKSSGGGAARGDRNATAEAGEADWSTRTGARKSGPRSCDPSAKAQPDGECLWQPLCMVPGGENRIAELWITARLAAWRRVELPWVGCRLLGACSSPADGFTRYTVPKGPVFSSSGVVQRCVRRPRTILVCPWVGF
jgi:hypothetical protein